MNGYHRNLDRVSKIGLIMKAETTNMIDICITLVSHIVIKNTIHPKIGNGVIFKTFYLINAFNVATVFPTLGPWGAILYVLMFSGIMNVSP